MLHELALEKKLPKHQYMDEGTLEWIVQTGKNMFGSLVPEIKFSHQIKDNLRLANPDEAFFTDRPIAHGIHGYRHCARVSLLAAQVYVARTEEPRLDILQTLMVAGSLHDCRRPDDNADTGHGARAADWLLNNQRAVAEWFKFQDSGSNYGLARTGIHYHETPLNDITETLDENQKLVLDIVKTADALDRYRQPLEKWWINNSYLEIKPTTELKAMAWRLVCLTEAEYLKSQNNQAALRSVTATCEYER